MLKKIITYPALLLPAILLIQQCTNPNENDWDSRNITHSEGQDNTAQIAIDSQNDIHIVYIAADSSIKYIKKTNTGKWTKPKTISSGNYYYNTPGIVCDSDDNIHVIWNERFNNAGKTKYSMKYSNADWSEPVEITTSENGQNKIAIDENDIIHVVGTGGNGSFNGETIASVYVKKVDGVWQSQELIPEASTNPDLDVSPNGNVFMVYENNKNQICLFYKIGNNAWKGPEIVSDTLSGYHYAPSVAALGDGQVIVSWTDRTYFKILYRIRSSEGEWSEIYVLPDFDNLPNVCRLFKDDLNNVYFAWSALSNNDNKDVFYKIRYSVGIWSNYQNVSNSTNWSTAISVAYNGQIHCIWTEFQDDNDVIDGNRDIYYDVIK